MLRTNPEESDPAKFWIQYIRLAEVEVVFLRHRCAGRIRIIYLLVRMIPHSTSESASTGQKEKMLAGQLYMATDTELSAATFAPKQYLQRLMRPQRMPKMNGALC